MSLESIGKILKAKRNELGLEIKDIASDLKVKTKSLEDIEQGNCNINDVYGLGYIRMYSKYLGVNIETNSIHTTHINILTRNNESLGDDIDNIKSVLNIRVVVVTFVVLVLSVMFVMFSSNDIEISSNVNDITKLKIDADNKVFVKQSKDTYIIKKYNVPLVIKANDSVEVQLLDAESKLLQTLHLRVGEVVQLPLNSKATAIHASIPDAIEIIVKN
ncbi:MAG: helix-turn-helix domain-containing protein [Rickettsiales bacterium]|nr:helix-turn-helix domain-containing protein [Rickettsiales bacterium]